MPISRASAASGSTVTASTSTRGSQRLSVSITCSRMSVRVVSVFGSKRKRRSPQPNSSRISRSLGSVIKITRIDSRTFSSPSDHASRPSAPTRGGKLRPCPKMFLLRIRGRPLLLGEQRDGEANLQERYPPEHDVEEDEDNEQQDEGAERDDRQRERADEADVDAVVRDRGFVVEDGFLLARDAANLLLQLVRDDEADVLRRLAQARDAHVHGQRDADLAARSVRVEEGRQLER